MRRLVYSPRAISDLYDITRYGRREFGEAQARRYAANIEIVCLKLADGRLRGRPSDDPIPGLWKHRAGSHLIFFHLGKPDTLEIVRVLHGKMNIEDHL
jgi:toxin ParE1/3/4